MTSESLSRGQSTALVEYRREPGRRKFTKWPPVRGLIDLAMASLVGGGPILAVRATRVMLKDWARAR